MGKETMFNEIASQYKDLTLMGDAHAVARCVDRFMDDFEQETICESLIHIHKLRSVVVLQFLGGFRYNANSVDLDLNIDYVFIGISTIESLYTFVERLLLIYNTNDFQIYRT